MVAEWKEDTFMYTWCTRCAEFREGTGPCPHCGHHRRGYLPVRLDDGDRKHQLLSDPNHRGKQ